MSCLGLSHSLCFTEDLCDYNFSNYFLSRENRKDKILVSLGSALGLLLLLCLGFSPGAFICCLALNWQVTNSINDHAHLYFMITFTDVNTILFYLQQYGDVKVSPWLSRSRMTRLYMACDKCGARYNLFLRESRAIL